MRRVMMLVALCGLVVGCRSTERCADGERLDEAGNCASVDACPAGRDPATGVCLGGGFDGGLDAGAMDSGALEDAGGEMDAGAPDAAGEVVDAGFDANVDAGGCSDDDQCTADGATVCDEPSGRCVECTPDTEVTVCGDSATCDPELLTCTGATPRSVMQCERCVASSECEPRGFDGDSPRSCVETRYGPTGGSLGFFCLDMADDRGPARCPAGFVAQMGTAREGMEGEFCLPGASVLTCQAYRDSVDPQVCVMNSDCGVPGLEDGVCVTFEPGLSGCTTSCTADIDCPSEDCIESEGGCTLPGPTDVI